MAKKKFWSETIEVDSILPIDITRPKAYVLANVPFDENHWTRVFSNQNNQIIVVRTTQSHPMSRQIQLKIEASSSLAPFESDELIKIIRFELGLDEKMEALREMQNKDLLVDIAVRSNPGFRIFANSNIQESAILTIFSQNTSFFNYLNTTKLFYEKYGFKVPWDKSLRGFPNNNFIVNMTSKDWKQLNLGYKEKFLSALTLEDLEKIEIYTNYPVLERGLKGLLNIKGIGHYTARCLLIYCVRRYDYAFLDSYVKEVLQHKYEFSGISRMNEYDTWINTRWPKDPALILHSLLLEYLPAYLQTYKYDT